MFLIVGYSFYLNFNADGFSKAESSAILKTTLGNWRRQKEIKILDDYTDPLANED
jgi:hypothetical protein